MKNLFLIACLFMSVSSKAQVNIYVDSSVAVSGAGTSWATAYKTLNEALNLANGASTTTQYNVSVAKGTYFPTGTQNSTNRDSTFAILRGGIKIYGGYPGGGGTRDFVANPTILSGNIGSSTDSLDNCYHVLILSNIASSSDSAIVDGFSIIKGNANGIGSKTFNGLNVDRNDGGGIHNTGTSAKVRFLNCSIMANFATSSGGGMFNSSASPGIINSSFTSNGSQSTGGGVYNNSSGAPVVSNCVFSANVNCAFYHNGSTSFSISNSSFSNNTGSFSLSGAVYQSNSNGACSISFTTFTNNTGSTAGALYSNNPTLTGCIFTGNRSLINGGAVYCRAGTIAGCTFTGNRATGYGGGVYFDNTSAIALTVSNSVFSRDTAAGGGGFCSISQTPTLNNCKFYWNRADYGGAIFSSAVLMNECTVSGNTATVNGGGLYSSGSYTIKSTLITGNKAVNNGGGIYSRNVGTGATLINVTLAGDTAINGLAMYDSSSNQTILNSIIYNGPNGIFNFANSNPAITYSVVEGGYAGTGNLNVDPKFVSPLASITAPDTTGNYNILSCSQAINSGLNAGSYTGLFDVAGFPRLFGTTVDRGAYEFQSAFTGAGTITGNSTVCANGTLQLANVTPGGVWTSTNTTLATVSATGLVSGVAPGSDTIIYTVAGSTSCSTSAIKIITVLPLPVVNPINGSSSLCVGTTSPMTNTTPSGVWSSSSTSTATINTSGVVNPIAAGNVNIIYTVTTAGCSNAVTLPVVVNPQPAVSAITGGPFVCINGTLQLANATTGGVWTSTNTSKATVDPSTGLVTGLSLGLDTINYTVTSGVGCIKNVMLVITIANLPTVGAITGGNTVCANGSLQLYDTTTLGVWSNSNPGLAVISNTGLVSAIAPGIDTIKYTKTNNFGCSAKASLVLTINPIPTVPPITGNSSVCINGTLQLSNSLPGGIWASTDPFRATVSGTGVVTPLTAGSVAITYTITDASNCSNSASFVIGITPVLVSVTQAGAVLTADQAGATYQWLDCNSGSQPISGQISQTFTATVNGLYAVAVTHNGCTDTSVCFAVTNLGIDGVDEKQPYVIYPNPTSGVAIFSSNLQAVPDFIKVFDIFGRSMVTIVPVDHTTVIDCATFPKGIYIIEVSTQGIRSKSKLEVR